MVRLRLALLLVWGLGCTTTETIPAEAASEGPDPNTTLPDEAGPSDTSPSEPPNEVPSPQDNGGGLWPGFWPQLQMSSALGRSASVSIRYSFD